MKKRPIRIKKQAQQGYYYSTFQWGRSTSPYNMKEQFPKAVAQAIVKQNPLITETYIIVLVGVSQDIINEL